MSNYITYEQYKSLGGTVDTTAFPRLELLAKKKLDYWTQNRITDANDDIRLCMTIIIDALGKIYRGEKDVASVSNDGVSVTYASAQTEEQMIGCVYDQIVEILPVELVSLEVGI